MVSAVQSSTSAAGSLASDRKIGQLSSLDFLNLMVKEMQHQDPFEPMSSKDMLAQVGQLRQMESSLELTKALEQLAANQQLAASSSMLGKMALGLDASGEQISGLVTSIRVEGDTVYLELDSGQRMNLNDVLQIYSPNEDAPTTDQQS